MAGEKRYDPTNRKLKKARQEGDVAKSKDFTGAAMLTTGFSWIIVFCLNSGNILSYPEKKLWFYGGFEAENVLGCIQEALFVVLETVGPFLLLIFWVVLISDLLQVGISFSWKSLAPKFSRLSFVAGLKRIAGFSGSGNSTGLPTALFFELAKLTSVVVVLGAVAGVFLWKFSWILLSGEAGKLELLGAGRIAFMLLTVALLIPIAILGFIDLLVQRRRRRERLRMDAQELKSEFRESEGDPELMGMRKQIHRELLVGAVLQKMRRAKVVVVNKVKKHIPID